jgi:methionine aminopeptidase
MKAEEIYKTIKNEVTKNIYNYDEQIVAIAKWVEFKLKEKNNGKFTKEDLIKSYENGQSDCGEFGNVIGFEEWFNEHYA